MPTVDPSALVGIVADVMRYEPTAPETYSAGFTVRSSFTEASSANGVAVSRGVGVTTIVSTLSVPAPWMSETRTRIVADCTARSVWYGCLYTSTPAGVTLTEPISVVFRADATKIGSPSGSTQPGSTGTVTVPPGRTSGLGQSCRQPSVPHQTGAEFTSSPCTVSVTVVDADSRPPVREPSVMA